MPQGTFSTEDLKDFESRIEGVRQLLKGAELDINEVSQSIDNIDKLLAASPESVFRRLDEVHTRLRKNLDGIAHSYEEAKKKYSELRGRGLGMIDNYIGEIRERKNRLLDLGYKVDEAIRNFVLAEKILDMRDEEVRLFNEIEDFYRNALLVTSQVKDMDSRASLLGYEFAEFSGKLFGLNKVLIFISNSIDAKNAHGDGPRPSSKYAQGIYSKDKGTHDFEHYIR